LEEFPLLDRVSRVYGAIAFYLDHKAEIDKYLEETEREFEASGILLIIRLQADADLNFDIGSKSLDIDLASAADGAAGRQRSRDPGTIRGREPGSDVP